MPMDRLGDPAGVGAADEDVGAADVEDRQRHHQRADVEQRPGVEEDGAGAQVLDVDQREVLPRDGGLAQHRAVRAPAERRRVYDQRGQVGIAVAIAFLCCAAGDEVFVARVAGVVAVERKPHRVAMTRLFARAAHCGADLCVLPDDDAGLEVIDHERHFVGGLPPVRRAEHRAELACGDDAFEHAVVVLREPQDAVAATHAGVFERIGEPDHAVGELRIGEPLVIGDRRDVIGSRAAVLFQDVGERQRVQRRDHACRRQVGSVRNTSLSVRPSVACCSTRPATPVRKLHERCSRAAAMFVSSNCPASSSTSHSLSS